MTEGIGRPGAAGPLSSTVERLRDEVEGLHRSKQHRAVIEQAKGVLMGRDGVDAATAFQRLRQQARDSNRRLVDVAADELAQRGSGAMGAGPAPTSLPDLSPDRTRAPAPTSPGESPAGTATSVGRPQPGRPSQRFDRSLVLLAAAAREATDAWRLLEVLRAHAQPVGADRAVLLSLGPDASLALVAHSGLPENVAQRWQHIPLTVDFPASHAARTGVPVFEDDLDAALERWPLLRRGRSPLGAFCDVPVVAGGVVVAVVGLGWPAGTPIDGAARLLLRSAVRTLADDIVRVLPPVGVHVLTAAEVAPADPAVRLALDAVEDECVLLLPHAREDDSEAGERAAEAAEAQAAAGAVTPSRLLLAWGNRAARDAAAGGGAGHRFGRTVGEVAPDVVESPLWQAVRHAVAGATPAPPVHTDRWFWGPVAARRITVHPLYHGALLVARPLPRGEHVPGAAGPP
ncbi:ANTAR domain-containing protein [Aquipuribacter nitratireducens]|uniref:ANTAR domain-containing protein n=1 Tax=Aquipuribacter nitratireducens TaxID=650104 RepID=A0ABW0GR53_9MICO